MKTIRQIATALLDIERGYHSEFGDMYALKPSGEEPRDLVHFWFNGQKMELMPTEAIAIGNQLASMGRRITLKL